METVREFTYLGDRVSAGGGCRQCVIDVSLANIYTFDVTLSGRSLIYNRKDRSKNTSLRYATKIQYHGHKPFVVIQ